PPHRRHARDTRTPRTPFRARAKPARHAGGSYVCLRRNSMTMTQALGWALVHSLWQCALAAAGLAALLAVVPARAARARYALAAATLALTLALPVGTLVRLHPASSETSVASAVPAAVAPSPAAIPRAPEASPGLTPLSAVGAPLRLRGARDRGAAAGLARPRTTRAPAPVDRGAVAHRRGDV